MNSKKKGSNSIRRMSAIEVNVSKSFWKEVVAKRPLEDKSCVVSQYRERPLSNWYYKSWEVILRMHTVEKQEVYPCMKNISWIQIFLQFSNEKVLWFHAILLDCERKLMKFSYCDVAWSYDFVPKSKDNFKVFWLPLLPFSISILDGKRKLLSQISFSVVFSKKKTFGKINNNVLTELLIKAIKERREKTRTLTCKLLHEMHGSCTVWKLHDFTLMLFFTKVLWNHPFWKLKFTANWFHEIIL